MPLKPTYSRPSYFYPPPSSMATTSKPYSPAPSANYDSDSYPLYPSDYIKPYRPSVSPTSPPNNFNSMHNDIYPHPMSNDLPHYPPNKPMSATDISTERPTMSSSKGNFNLIKFEYETQSHANIINTHSN